MIRKHWARLALLASPLAILLLSYGVYSAVRADDDLPPSLINHPELLRALQAAQADSPEAVPTDPAPLPPAAPADPVPPADPLPEPPAPPPVVPDPVEPPPAAPTPVVPAESVPDPAAPAPVVPPPAVDADDDDVEDLDFAAGVDPVGHTVAAYSFLGSRNAAIGSLRVERTLDEDPLLRAFVDLEWLDGPPADVVLVRLERSAWIPGAGDPVTLEPILIEGDDDALGRTSFEAEYLLAPSDLRLPQQGEIYSVAVSVRPIFRLRDGIEPFEPLSLPGPELTVILDDRANLIDARPLGRDAYRATLRAYVLTELLDLGYPNDEYVARALDHAKSAWREAQTGADLVLEPALDRRSQEKIYFQHRYRQMIHSAAAAQALALGCKRAGVGELPEAEDAIAAHRLAATSANRDYNGEVAAVPLGP